MDVNAVICTSLETLLERATNSKNKNLDVAAFNAFSSMVCKESRAASTAVKLIIPKLQSHDEWGATQALSLLENCMENAGSNFQAEVGKFKFLNELIKLVSTKHRGNQTPYSVRNKIIQVLYSWSVKYPSEFKIKEACEMLKKQGVTLDDVVPINIGSNSVCNPKPEAKVMTENEKKEKLLQKLLQSAKPHDLRAANLLIQTMVKEEEDKEVLDDLKNTLDLKIITNNVKLLSEMLAMYSSNSSHEDAEIITQLYDGCVNMKSPLANMIMSHSKSSHIYADLLSLNDYLNDTIAHYQDIFHAKDDNNGVNDNTVPILSLVDLGSPTRIQNSSSSNIAVEATNKSKTNLDSLEEIFSLSLDPLVCSTENIAICDPSVVTCQNKTHSVSADSVVTSNGPMKKRYDSLFDDLDTLGKSMLDMKINSAVGPKTESSSKLTLNELATRCRPETKESPISAEENSPQKLNDADVKSNDGDDNSKTVKRIETPTSDDDVLLLDSDNAPSPSTSKQKTVQPLGDLHVPLVKIIPGSIKKIPALDDDNDLKVELQVAGNKPRDDVTVYLIFVSSKKEQAISEFLFQPIVPKDCRLKLQPPTRTSLPPYNPYIPNEMIVQIMLIASSNQDHIPLKFVVSYKIDDETFTEMGQIDALRL